jgi:predicted membrane protein
VIFVIARTVPMIVVCSWAFKKAPEAYRPGVWIPVLNMFTDMFESLLLAGLIKAFPHRNKAIELLTAYVIQLKWRTFQATLAIMFISLLVGIYYAFHTLLADSVVLEKDRQQKLAAREKVQDVLQRQAARRATDAGDSSGKKNA